MAFWTVLNISAYTMRLSRIVINFRRDQATQRCRELHQRRARFNQARNKIKTGVTSLSKLGLLAEDCSWAILQAERAKDPEDWRSRFKQAEKTLQETH